MDQEPSVMQILKAGLFYFALVFSAGFILGPIRLRWGVPRFGTRIAELLETPILVVVVIAAAWWVVRYLAIPPIKGHLATRDPVSGTFYYLTLGVFAIMPLLMG